MTDSDSTSSRLARPLILDRTAHLSWLYAAALLTSALLLFWVQPLFTKMVLPLFGGAPAVWTTAAMFFQVALLAGYLYAHLISQKLPLKYQALLHLALLLAVFGALPVSLGETATTDATKEPVTALLRLLAVCLGLPFFAVAATAPLLQRWFSYTRHDDAADPYFLYSASNLGSIAALLGYPIVIEPLLGLVQQGWAWMAGYATLTALIATCAFNALHHRHTETPGTVTAGGAEPGVSWMRRGHWMLLAFAPASLMLGVTQHVTAEIAAVPLLWIVPLLLYMLTYVNVFARRPLLRHEWMLKLQPPLVMLIALVWILNNYLSVFFLHLAVFFVTAMMCHGELARLRPHTAHLTEFYLYIALGGALGGAFNAIAAPLLFDVILEYPLILGLACMLRPAADKNGRAFRTGDAFWPLALAAGYGLCVAAGYRPLEHGAAVIIVYLQVIGLALYLSHPRPVRFGLMAIVVIVASPILHSPDEVLSRHRSFFGVHTVLKDKSGKFHVLLHGITIHGAQYIAPDKRREPTTYFHRDSPLGQLFSALGKKDRFQRVAAVGLGAGTTACYRRPGQEWTFFELDPTVVRIASDTRYFSFLADCAPDSRIVIGDGRLALKAAPDRHFDLIIIDTFSSDAIPMHMITREALALYMGKLRESGVIMFHITNQYLDLAPVLANLAAAAGLAAMKPGPRLAFPPDDRFAAMESNWVAVTRKAGDLTGLESEEGWEPLLPSSPARLWTDDFSNIVGALK
jgi:hypothetical protein